MSKYKRTPIFFNKNTVAVIHIFTRCDFLEDLWMEDCIAAISPENPYEQAAQQFVDQFEDHWTPAFLMELRQAITKKLEEHDKVHGTKFA